MNQVSVSFALGRETLTALHEVSLGIGQGEVLALVGPSGCGKTTILNLIAGFARPTAGMLTVSGTPVAGPGADRAVVFQADAVFPWLTVRRNLEYGPRIRKAYDQAAAERVGYYLRAMGLERFENAYPKVLSGGMRKRVDVARAYVNEPGVILLDEPFGALDELLRTTMVLEMQRIWLERPHTTVLVTHSIQEAVMLADSVVVMAPHPGRIHTTVNVPFARPRPEELARSAEFHELCDRISVHLAEASGRDAPTAPRNATARAS